MWQAKKKVRQFFAGSTKEAERGSPTERASLPKRSTHPVKILQRTSAAGVGDQPRAAFPEERHQVFQDAAHLALGGPWDNKQERVVLIMFARLGKTNRRDHAPKKFRYGETLLGLEAPPTASSSSALATVPREKIRSPSDRPRQRCTTAVQVKSLGNRYKNNNKSGCHGTARTNRPGSVAEIPCTKASFPRAYSMCACGPTRGPIEETLFAGRHLLEANI